MSILTEFSKSIYQKSPLSGGKKISKVYPRFRTAELQERLQGELRKAPESFRDGILPPIRVENRETNIPVITYGVCMLIADKM